MQRAAYIIKPEGMAHRAKIRRAFSLAGLHIISRKRVVLTLAAVDTLYPDLDPDLRGASLKFLTCAPVEIGVLEGKNVLAKLRMVLGHRTDPDECRLGTIRNKFGLRPGVKFGKAVYYLNGLHGSKDEKEATRDLLLYASLPALRPARLPLKL